MLWLRRQRVEPEPWYAFDDRTGALYGPFDPGAVYFCTAPQITAYGLKLRALQQRADMILSAAGAGTDRLRRLLATGVQGGMKRLDTGWNPPQTPFLVGISGGLDTDGYLGDGAASAANGLHIDDSKDDTNPSGAGGGSGGDNGVAESGDMGDGAGAGGGGSGGVAGDNGNGGGGGGYGANGTSGTADGSNSGPAGRGGNLVPAETIWGAMRANSFTLDILGYGAGGGGGGARADGGGGSDGGAGGGGGAAYIEIVNGTLTTVARTVSATAGGTSTNGGGGGGGAGGLWLGIAATITHGSGTINSSGGAGGASSGGNGGAGSDGRVIQVYFDGKATLTVSGATQTDYRILRSVPIGQNVFL